MVTCHPNCDFVPIRRWACQLSNNNPVMHTSKTGLPHRHSGKIPTTARATSTSSTAGCTAAAKDTAFNPPGSKIVFTETDNQYVMQVVLPWSALNVPDGKNPFKPGSRMTAIFGLHWRRRRGFTRSTRFIRSSPGDFAFMQWQDWGQVEFSPTGNVKPRHGTMEEALATAQPSAAGRRPDHGRGAEDGKLSLNIVGKNGEVIRDVIGGQPVKPGKYTAYWDGRDQWGFAQTPVIITGRPIFRMA